MGSDSEDKHSKSKPPTPWYMYIVYIIGGLVGFLIAAWVWDKIAHYFPTLL